MLMKLGKKLVLRSFTYFEIGRDIYNFSREVIKERLGQNSDQKNSVEVESFESPKNEASTDFIKRNQQSMTSQTDLDRSGSTHDRPNKPSEKWNSNMMHRNYDNHQGN